MYPNARILDIEKEKDYMEVSIWDENKEKDVYFAVRRHGWEPVGTYVLPNFPKL